MVQKFLRRASNPFVIGTLKEAVKCCHHNQFEASVFGIINKLHSRKTITGSNSTVHIFI